MNDLAQLVTATLVAFLNQAGAFIASAGSYWYEALPANLSAYIACSLAAPLALGAALQRQHAGAGLAVFFGMVFLLAPVLDRYVLATAGAYAAGDRTWIAMAVVVVLLGSTMLAAWRWRLAAPPQGRR